MIAPSALLAQTPNSKARGCFPMRLVGGSEKGTNADHTQRGAHTSSRYSNSASVKCFLNPLWRRRLSTVRSPESRFYASLPTGQKRQGAAEPRASATRARGRGERRHGRLQDTTSAGPVRQPLSRMASRSRRSSPPAPHIAATPTTAPRRAAVATRVPGVRGYLRG